MATQENPVAYEQALRVPLIVAGPEIPEGTESDALVELFDVNPTICELAGVPSLENIDASSLRPLLHGETSQHRDAAISSIARVIFFVARTLRMRSLRIRS